MHVDRSVRLAIHHIITHWTRESSHAGTDAVVRQAAAGERLTR
jgi:hypothetical protein